MIRQSFFSLIFLLSFFFSCEASPVRGDVLYDEIGKPSSAVVDILEAFCIKHDGSWSSIMKETQKAWLQNAQKERWEMAIREDKDPDKTYLLFSHLGMTETFYAAQHEYEYAILLGSALKSARDRFWFLKTLWGKNIRFKKLVVLTGDRPLSPGIEGPEELLDPECSPYPFRADWFFDGKLPSNETEMMKLVFDQLDLPIEVRNLEVLFVDTPRPMGSRRPHTSDTFACWLHMMPAPGSALVISNQPFVGRQDTIARKYLPDCFSIETVGLGFDVESLKSSPRSLTILLDELARWIYEEVTKSETSFNRF